MSAGFGDPGPAQGWRRMHGHSQSRAERGDLGAIYPSEEAAAESDRIGVLRGLGQQWPANS
ncbi:MAG: hypothetical protein J2P28_24260, partial [Actinobacteria bacterium]|nr:hypothetical protein [Actinomycetota bacterium]